ncbi:MAG: hypothetical protein JNK01_16070 [Devosia sp.]|nr:hypothetical protein [Devosia sp.]
MNKIRPLAGALLATLMLSPLAGAALAGDVLPLDPGGGLPPIDGTGPAGTGPVDELTPPGPIDSGSSDGGGDSDYVPEPTLQTRHFGLNVQLSCAVSGTPNAIVVVNHSAEDLPPGTRIKWQLKSEGKRGFFALLRPLAGGDTLVADNVLDGATNQTTDCVARVI